MVKYCEGQLRLKIYKHILIDGNNLFWRALLSQGKIEKKLPEDFYRKGIKHAFEMVNRLEETFLTDDGEMFFLFDNPFSKINIRKWITDGEYKHPRKAAPREFYETMNVWKEMLLLYSDKYWLFKSKNREADDLTEPLLKHLPDEKALLVSNDMDWARSMHQNVDWLFDKTVYTVKSFETKYGFSPVEHHIKMYKSIHGDKIDAIPNAVPHISRDLLLYLIKTYTSIKSLFVALPNDDNIPEQWKRKFYDAKRRLETNWDLVNFLDIEGNILDYGIKGSRSVADIKVYYEVLSIPLESFMIQTEDDFVSSLFEDNGIEVR